VTVIEPKPKTTVFCQNRRKPNQGFLEPSEYGFTIQTSLKAKTKGNDSTLKAKAKDSTLKAKAKIKDFKIVLEDPRDKDNLSSRTPTLVFIYSTKPMSWLRRGD